MPVASSIPCCTVSGHTHYVSKVGFDNPAVDTFVPAWSVAHATEEKKPTPESVESPKKKRKNAAKAKEEKPEKPMKLMMVVNKHVTKFEYSWMQGVTNRRSMYLSRRFR